MTRLLIASMMLLTAGPLFCGAAPAGGSGASAGSALPPAPEKPVRLRTEYYYGDVVYFSEDGKTEKGRTLSLVKREVNPARKKIIETVLQPARAPGGRPEKFTVELLRAGPTSLFRAGDREGTFSGTILFSRGSAWNWTQWLYDLKFRDGGTIKGLGKLIPGGLAAEKTYTDKEQTVTVIREDLKKISRNRYGSIFKEMMSGAGKR